MKKFTRILSVLLCTAMLLSLAACGGSTSSSTSSSAGDPASQSQDSSSSQQEETPDDQKPAAAGTVTSILGGTAPTEVPENTIRVGVVTYLSDARASLRELFQIGWETAALTAVKDGGLEGKNVEFLMFDANDDPGMLQQHLATARDMGCVSVIHACGDQMAPTSAAWAAENHFPVINITLTSTKTTFDNFSPYCFNGATNAWSTGRIFAYGAVGLEGKKNFVYVGKDGAACEDVLNFLLFEGKKIDPEFEILGDYRVSATDTEFTSIISAVMGIEPDMILEQGAGATLASFTQQANQFGLLDKTMVYADYLSSADTSAELYAAGSLPLGQVAGVCTLPWWDEKYLTEDIAEYCDTYMQTELAQKTKWATPSSGYGVFRAIQSLFHAVQDCMDAGSDYTDHEVLTTAIKNVKWTDSLGDHYYRDFDNQLTGMVFYGVVDTVTEEGIPVASEIHAFTAEEALPSKEDMKAWAEQIGFDHQGRFD